MYPTTKQFIQTIQWSSFNGGYSRSVEEVPAILESLCDIDDEGEALSLLFGDLLSHVKQGYLVFEIIVPVIDVFDQLGREGYAYPAVLLDFLAYVYTLDIRNTVPILTIPVRYSFGKKEEAPSNGFTSFKTFFEQHFHKTDDEALYASDVYYTALLLPAAAEISRIFDIISENSDNTSLVKNAVISAAVINYQLSEKTSLPDAIIRLLTADETLSPYIAVFNGISGFKVQQEELQELLEAKEDLELQWAQAFITVIATDALLIGNLSDAGRLKMALDGILPVLEEEKKAFEEEQEQEMEFPLYPFMAEDLTSIVFGDFLNKGSVLDLSALSEVQRYCLERLYALKIHTHAMLHAGLLPEGITPDTQPILLPIYNYSV